VSNLLAAVILFLTGHSVNGEVIITSNLRTPESQVEAMAGLVSRGVDIRSLYARKSLIEPLAESLKNDNKAKAIHQLREQVANGDYLSSHLCGKAVDISLRSFKKSDYRKIPQLVMNNFKDVQVIFEGNHFHIEEKGGC
jgi:uncharacterized protein YcbK (DUF882 family)